MYDPQSKRRDLRRAYLSGNGPRIRDIFRKEHPEFNTPIWHSKEWWDICCQKEEEWLAHKLGISYYDCSWGNAPASFRRNLNRAQRSKEKSVLRRAFLKDEWDDFQLPRYRHNANWLWW